MVPASFEALGLDATTRGALAAEQGEGDGAQHGEVVGGVAHADAALVRAESDVQDPVHRPFSMSPWLRTARLSVRAGVGPPTLAR